MPSLLDMADASTQGEIGYLLQQALGNEVRITNLERVGVETAAGRAARAKPAITSELPPKEAGDLRHGKSDREGDRER